MKEKIKRKIIWDDSGVSEILGDVFILAMTVVLFSSVFLFVWSLPAPDEDLYADFESSLKLTESGGLINITHIGGETLKGAYTTIYLYKNIAEEIRILNTQGSDEDNPEYGISGDPNWDTGEKWEYYFSGISEDDDVSISVVDTKTTKLIMGARLLGSGFNIPPIIMERWCDPDPAKNDCEVTIFAKVMDHNGKEDIESVYVNASILNPALDNVEMYDPDLDGTYETDIMVTIGKGDYKLAIAAVDSGGMVDYGRLEIRVVDAQRPIIEIAAVEPNSVKVTSEFTLRALVIDLNNDLNLSNISISPEQGFFDDQGSIESSLDLIDEVPYGGIFETTGYAPSDDGEYELVISASDYEELKSTKTISLAVIRDEAGKGNNSFNDSIWAYLGPESVDFLKFYYTTDNPPKNSTMYNLAVYVQEEHIGSDCYFHINVINHYFEDVYIDGNSKIRFLQIGGAASNKDIDIVQNGTDFGGPVGTTPDGTWYKIPKDEEGDYFHGGDPVSLVFGPFDLQSAKQGDVFGTILVLTGSYGSESTDPDDRMGQTLPYQAVVIA